MDSKTYTKLVYAIYKGCRAQKCDFGTKNGQKPQKRPKIDYFWGINF